jgi:hypothetical protein
MQQHFFNIAQALIKKDIDEALKHLDESGPALEEIISLAEQVARLGKDIRNFPRACQSATNYLEGLKSVDQSCDLVKALRTCPTGESRDK